MGSFSCAAEQVPEGLDLAVQKMKKGESAEVTLSPKYGFGATDTQRPQGVVPANSTVIYTVELLDFENVRSSVTLWSSCSCCSFFQVQLSPAPALSSCQRLNASRRLSSLVSRGASCADDIFALRKQTTRDCHAS